MSETTTNFQALVDVLVSNNLLQPGPAPVWLRDHSESDIQAAVRKGALLLPTSLIDAYAQPLEQRLPAVLAWLEAKKLDPALVEAMTGAVSQFADDALRPGLHRFLAVISNLYRSFLSQVKRRSLSVPLAQQLPPLAVWQSSPVLGPFTIPVDQAAEVLGAKVGVVSMPAGFADHPFLFSSLSHEVGGHDVLHADADLLPQLSRGVHGLFTGPDAWLGLLWDYWMDEAASDVYGLLNMGPMFATSLAALLGVFLAGDGNRPGLRTVSGADGNGELDVHPTDVLRLSLAQGAIESLQGLSGAHRQSYLDQLDDLIDLAVDGADTIELTGAARSYSGHVIQFQHQAFSLAELQVAARKVGAWIATVKLPALAGRSIQDIETWDDADESVASAIGASLLRGASVVSAGDDAQLLAGLSLALIQRPDQATYRSATALTNAALDDSFRKDPYWGTPLPDRWVMKSALRATPREPAPDPIVAAILDHNALDDSPVAMLAPEAAASHSFKALAWPAAELEPRPVMDTQPKAGSKLAPCDVVVFTYTVDEANALAAVMTPGAMASPSKRWAGSTWFPYTHRWSDYAPRLVRGSSPALQSKDLGVFMRTTIDGKSVLCFKSSLHLARDDKSMPIRDLVKQIAEETGAKLFITTGTAGGIGKKVLLGDAVISTAAKFDLVKRFRGEPENHRTYTSAFRWKDTKFVDIVNKQLLPANLGSLPSAPRAPRLFTDTHALGEPNVIITTDGFLYDDAADTFHLQGNGCMVEMDDAVVAMALAGGPTWLAIRNASDPQVPAGSSPHDASKIYLKYGFYTSLTSVLGCWAAICGGDW
jgi:hypothetical protein